MEPLAVKAVLGGRYELGQALGSGGFGTVFRARDRRSGAEVAIKLVAIGLGSEPAAARLRREGAVLRRVTSRHVARFYDSGEDERGVWIVTELVDGAPFVVATLGRPLLPHEVLRAARGLLEGLAAVHAAGVIHGDVKPSNVLVPRGDKALDGAKLVDFGLARIAARSEIAASIGDAMTREGTVLGTARYMAPEVLSGGEPTARSDLYAAGLVLFDLLGLGPLFQVGDARSQLRARVTVEPTLQDRVPQPLSDVLSRMLARDPAARYVDAGAAHEAVADLDTAPVSVAKPDSIKPSGRPSGAPSVPSGPPSLAALSRPTAAPSDPSRSRSTVPPMATPSSGRVPGRPSRPPVVRLTSLPTDSVAALRETLRHLDLPMLDALARRERGNPSGRIARAVALALRLELDAAALILEPLAPQSDVARAIGASVLAPRARRVTRARVDADREDKWVDTVDAELGAMLVALGASLAASDDAPRDAERCARALARLEKLPASPSVESTRTTLRIAHTAARVRRGEIDRGVGLDLVAPLGGREGWLEAPYHVVVRALSSAPLTEDELRTSVDLDRAERVAAETGTTLLDACAATALGAFYASSSPRDERGLLVLERACTLLVNGDAPSLEHEAEQHRATALIAVGRWDEAVTHLRAAREAAHSERTGELEVLSAALQSLAELASGDLSAASESAAFLGDGRLGAVRGRTAALAWVARALSALARSEKEAAEDALTEAEARVREADRRGADVYVLVEITGMMFDAVRGALPDLSGAAARLERFAEEHRIEPFYWLDLLAAVIRRVPDAASAQKMNDVLDRLGLVLGAEKRRARERPTDAPPAPM